MNRSFCRLLLVVALTLCPVCSGAQTNTLSSLSQFPALQRITSKAGLIFSGTVVAVRAIRERDSDQISSVEVTFQVEQTLRGPRAGQRFSIREWPGLWLSSERYRVGERMMIFLYPPSHAGFTSPVEGGAGRFDVDREGRISVKPGQTPLLLRNAGPIRSATDARVPLGTFSRAIRSLIEESR